MKKLMLLIIPIFLISSCKTYVPFTNQLKTNNNWNENDLKQIQFYLSNTIVLHRELGKSETKIESGVIKIKNGKEVEEIIIKKGTPGLITKLLDSNKMGISFEIDDGYFLTFGSYTNRNGRYYLMLKGFEKDKWAKVTYVTNEYYISQTSLQAFIQVDMKRIIKEEKKQRVASGRQL